MIDSGPSNGKRYKRARVSRTGTVPVDAAAYWRVLRDWPAVLTWMREKRRPVPLIKVELKAGHQVGRIPCTRNCWFDVSALPAGVLIPECVAETLLHADEVARTIYYNMEGEGPFGLRNYLAITEVDALGPSKTQVTCSGRFDLPSDVPEEAVSSVVASVYESIITDIAVAVSRASP